MMNRRFFLRGLIAAPIVITTPGLLMPVKAIPTPFAYVKGVWLDGTPFVKEVMDQMPAMNVAKFDWFDNVASITSYEYTDNNPETNPFVFNSEKLFSSFSRHIGKPMPTMMDRVEYSPLRGKIELEDYELVAYQKIDELKKRNEKHTLDANGKQIGFFSWTENG